MQPLLFISKDGALWQLGQWNPSGGWTLLDYLNELRKEGYEFYLLVTSHSSIEKL